LSVETGKTLLAKAVAKILRSGGGSSSVDIGGAFISLSSSDIVRAEVGTSEKLVSAAFQTARANSPSVVFIDEFQALFTERNRGGSGRLSTTLLQCMDDLNQWRDIARRGKAEQENDGTSEVRVLVLAATNTPWALDRSFLRSGRFDRAVHVGLPDAEERKAILALYMGRMKMDAAIDIATYCDRLSKRLDGFSGADLSALCRAAAMRCLVEGSQSINEEHFDAVLNEGFAASSSRALVERIKQWRP
jgi:SpoVK/Ycf46/Vps4 family AAA+-type ATPase